MFRLRLILKKSFNQASKVITIYTIQYVTIYYNIFTTINFTIRIHSLKNSDFKLTLVFSKNYFRDKNIVEKYS